MWIITSPGGMRVPGGPLYEAYTRPAEQEVAMRNPRTTTARTTTARTATRPTARALERLAARRRAARSRRELMSVLAGHHGETVRADVLAAMDR